MTYSQTVLPELIHEMQNTRKVLERVPDEKLDWSPHPKSHTIGWNASHLADIIGWVENVLTEPSFDIHPPGGTPHESPALKSREEILKVFDENFTHSKKILENFTDAQTKEIWSLLANGQAIASMPRPAALRSVIISHIIHHRAILCVYLRLNNIPVPGLYGPSGDE